MIHYRRFLEEQISIQRRAIARCKAWVTLLIGGGVAILVLVQFVSIVGVAGTEVMRLAGAFVGTIALFPYREITPREERIATYSVLLGAVRSYPSLPPDEQQRLVAVVTEAMKETLKR